MKLLKILIIGIIFFLLQEDVNAAAFEYGYTSDGYKYVIHKHKESSYQHVWCSSHNGIEEFENSDKTRVDCLTETHAIEFDFAEKWAVSVGQALHYSKLTGKRAMVVLILENPKKQMCYFQRVQKLGEIHNFDVEYVTPETLTLTDNKCQFPDCRCHKSNTKKLKFLNMIKYFFKTFLNLMEFVSSVDLLALDSAY